ncbi:MAG: thiamine biosynthesis lipoprotein [Marivirga sp.]|jgi:thiamine biosynthesis lipoprotein
MDHRKKNAVYSLVLIVAVVAIWMYRDKTEKEPETVTPYTFVSGEAQGTTYNITYQDTSERNFKKAIDSLLLAFDKSLSTYRQYSEISHFNREDIDSLVFISPYFYPVMETSKKVYEASQGAFDPTIHPLINAWGFGKEASEFPDTIQITAIRDQIGFNKIAFDEKAVWKLNSMIGLNFNAIAQGYAIDVLYDFLVSQDIDNLMIELGGEVRTKGKNDRDLLWSIGIDNPRKESGINERSAIIKLNNEAMSTSGNYRNFFVHEGVTYGHTIDPRTGFPVQRDIISATVIAPSCMEADAWSTAFMVLGLEASKQILETQTTLKAFLMYEDAEGRLQEFSSETLGDNIVLAE